MRNRSPRRKPQIPDHTVLSWIGGGSYGDVWLCRNIMGQPRAVKVIHEDNFDSDRPFSRAFNGLKVYEPISRSHPGLVHVLQIGRNGSEAYFYYVMELADRQEALPESEEYRPKTLESVLRTAGRMRVNEVLDLASKLAQALGHLHRHELIHRDIKPSNIIFVNGQPKVADIDLVAATDSAKTFVGTEGFVAPEGPYSPRADIYSLGKVLYEAATGKDRCAYPEPCLDAAREELPRLQKFFEILFRACEANPAKRYAAADEMLKDLALVQAGKAVRHIPEAKLFSEVFLRWAAIVTMAGALAGSAFLYDRNKSSESRKPREEKLNPIAGVYVANGIRHLDEGDPLGSLPWFVEALRLDQGDPAREEMHRQRIGAILEQSPKLLALGAHAGAIEYAEFSRDGRRIVTASADRTARVWNAETSEPVTPPLPHESRVNYASFSPDGLKVVTASDDHRARVWNALTGSELTKPLPHEGSVHKALFTPDGKLIVTVSADRTARIWNSDDGSPLGEGLSHSESVDCLAVSPDGKLIVTGSRDGIARIWKTANGEPVGSPLQHSHGIESIAFSPDGSLIATGSSDKTARLWDATTGMAQTGPLQHIGGIAHVEFTEDGKSLLSAGGLRERGELRLWNPQTGEPLRDAILSPGPFTEAHLSSDNAFLLAAQEGNVRLISLERPEISNHAIFQQNGVTCVEFAPDSRRVLVCGKTGVWRIWDLAFGFVPSIPQPEIWHYDFSPDGRQIATSSRFFSRLRDAENLSLAGPQEMFSPMVGSARFSPDGRWLGIGGNDHARLVPLTINEGTSPKLLGRASDVVFSPDSSRVAAFVGTGGIVELYEATTGKRLSRIELEGSSLRILEFTENGNWLIAAGQIKNDPRNAEVHILDGQTWLPASPAIPHQGTVQSIAVSSDSRFLLTGCSAPEKEPRAAKLWEIPSGRFTGIEFPHEEDGVVSVAFSPDGRFVATGGKDGVVKIWEAGTGKSVSSMRHLRGVVSVQFSRDSKKLLTASVDRTVRLWEVASGNPLSGPIHHEARLLEARFRPHRESFITFDETRMLRVWSFPKTQVRIPDLVRIAGVLSGRKITNFGDIADIEDSAATAAFKELWPARPDLGETSQTAFAWHCVRAQTAERQRKWKTAAFHLEQALQLNAGDENTQVRRDRACAELHQQQRRSNQTGKFPAEAERFYPSQKPDLDSKFLDLSAFYNAPLYGDWRFPSISSAALPLVRGVSDYNGIEFDVRGIVQLGEGHDAFKFPSAVKGIPVHRKVRSIYFLHGLDGQGSDKVASYRIHYVNGEEVYFGIVSGQHLHSWRVSPKIARDSPNFAWQGTFPVGEGFSEPASLFIHRWFNKYPDAEIDRIDFEHASEFPFLLAITLE